MATEYNRYEKFVSNGEMKLVPFAKIPVSGSDRYIRYRRGRTRLDIVSNEHYGSPNYGWLILQANPSVGALEYAIPDGTLLRIPYPLETSIANYKNSIKLYDELYGIE